MAALLEKKHELEINTVGMRDGIEIEKGVVLTTDWMIENEKHLRDVMSYFTAYPDMFLDFITPTDSGFQLFFYQRITLRVMMRFKDIYLTAPRAFSKTFITILSLILQCILLPGTRRFICSPGKSQSAAIAKEKIYEIYERWPLIRREVVGGDIMETPGNFGKDYVTLRFRNGSVFDIVAPLDSQRGGRRHGGLVDETRDHEEAPINEIVLPLLNVSRRLPDGSVNPKEPNQQRIFATSAGTKTSFAYDLLVDILEESIIQPKTAFCFGFDLRVPVMHGLLDRDYVNKLKSSPSYNENSFAREYLSRWSGGADESWFNFEKMRQYRKIKNPELRVKNIGDNKNCYYQIAIDVGRLNDQTVATVFRVNVRSDGKHYATLVNLFVLARQAQTKTFTQQAIDVKRLIRDFQPREVVIDTNGLGVGLADEMIKPQYDDCGEYYPPYGFNNAEGFDGDYLTIQPKDAEKILVGIKASGPLNSKIHSNAYARINGGMVRFLISEQEAKSALMSTQVGQKMTTMERVQRLMPHEMTSKLFDEMARHKLALSIERC